VLLRLVEISASFELKVSQDFSFGIFDIAARLNQPAVTAPCRFKPHLSGGRTVVGYPTATSGALIALLYDLAQKPPVFVGRRGGALFRINPESAPDVL
jgi:hypothetical protein